MFFAEEGMHFVGIVSWRSRNLAVDERQDERTEACLEGLYNIVDIVVHFVDGAVALAERGALS